VQVVVSAYIVNLLVFLILEKNTAAVA